MASVNKVILVGNLGRDPELRYTNNQTPVATLRIATTESRPDQDGQRQEHTEWHQVVVWSRQAENCAKYLAKGRSVYVEGRLQTRSWDDKATGQKRYSTEIVAQTVQFLGGRGEGAAASFGAGNTQEYAPTPSFDNGSSYGSAPQQPVQPAQPAAHVPNLDDIPF